MLQQWKLVGIAADIVEQARDQRAFDLAAADAAGSSIARRHCSRVRRGVRNWPSLMVSASSANCAQSPRKSDRIVMTI